jgi:hypothetical protein
VIVGLSAPVRMWPHVVAFVCAAISFLPASVMAEDIVFKPVDSAPAHEFRISNYGTHFAGVSASSPGSGIWVDVNAVPPKQFEKWTFTFCKVDYLVTWEDGATQEFHQDTCAAPDLVLTY